MILTLAEQTTTTQLPSKPRAKTARQHHNKTQLRGAGIHHLLNTAINHLRMQLSTQRINLFPVIQRGLTQLLRSVLPVRAPPRARNQHPETLHHRFELFRFHLHLDFGHSAYSLT